MDKTKQINFDGYDKNIVEEIVSVIKDKHLPTIFAGFKMEFKEEINQLKK